MVYQLTHCNQPNDELTLEERFRYRVQPFRLKRFVIHNAMMMLLQILMQISQTLCCLLPPLNRTNEKASQIPGLCSET